MLPASKTWSRRELADAAKLNEQVRDVQEFLSNPPFVVLRRTETWNVTGGADTPITWQSSSSNGFTLVNSGSNVTGAKVKYPGRYRFYFAICGRVSGGSSEFSHLSPYLAVDGTVVQRSTATVETQDYMDTAYVDAFLDLEAGQTVSGVVWITGSGRKGALAVDPQQREVTQLFGYWIGQ
ncbi:hypothetical protein H9W91_07340 [Streptomyces alfalfae]|uniref:hypothetical protein n=1 Tax=Streptomyces alfalfae TaxID=1642299 RepID=UPI001BAA67DC|nr:hypothetical protein [Streptomyces alfalfae]QUI30693.1 hypothetical protein H9W91_07340 [Streptomyces alfalfae]